MLGIRKQVCNEFPYIELAKPTLKSIIHRRQYMFFKNCTCERDWPLQRHIIRQGLDSKCSYIRYYNNLVNSYTSVDEITDKCMKYLKDEVTKKANKGQSRYMSYIEMNPTLSKPAIYSAYIPTMKIQNVTRIRMISHSLQIELGRHKRPTVPKNERLCSCGDIESEEHFLLKCNL